MRISGIAILVLVACVSLPGAAGAELELPTRPLRQYYQAERARGAERSEPLSRALVFLARDQPVATRLEFLEQAAAADPTWVTPHLGRIGLELRQRDAAGASLAARDAVRCVREDAVQQARWLRGVERGAHALLLATLVTLALLMFVRTLFFVQHLAEAQPRRAGIATGIAALGLFWCLWQSPLLALLVILLGLASFMTRKERRTLAALCVLLAVVEIPVPWLQRHAMLLDPHSASARLAAAQREGGDARLEAALVRDVPHGRERELVLGLLARRRGDLAGAERHYMAAITADPEWDLAYVNLANVYFARGDMQRAAAGYRQAQTLVPTNAFAHANMAQTYIRMLHYGEADEELHQASSLGFEKITRHRAAWVHNQVPVLDVMLGPAALLRLAGDEARAKPSRAEMLLHTWRGPGWDGLSPWKSAVVLLGLALVLLSRLRLRAVAYECTRCTRVLCVHCAPRMRDGGSRLCPFCDLQAPRVDRREPRADEPLPARPRRPLPPPPRQADRMPRWIGTLFPGAADLTRGAPVAAACTALVAWCALLAANAVVAAADQRAQPWFVAANAGALRLAILVFFLAHLQGLLRLRRAWPRLGAATRATGGR